MYIYIYPRVYICTHTCINTYTTTWRQCKQQQRMLCLRGSITKGYINTYTYVYTCIHVYIYIYTTT